MATLIPEALLARAFQSAEKIQDARERAGPIIALATRLVKAGHVAEAFERAGIGGDAPWDLQADAIQAFAPHLCSNELRHAFQLSLASTPGAPRTKALSRLVTYLPGDLIPTALEALGSIDDDLIGNFAGALAARLTESQLREAIHQFQTPGLRWQGAVLVHLIPRFAEIGDADEALAMVPGIDAHWPRALTLGQISRHLPARLIPRALELARGIPDDPLRPGGVVFVLRQLACRLEGEEKSRLLDEALDHLAGYDSDYYRWNDLLKMSPDLSLTQARHGLGMLRGLKSEEDARAAFVALVARVAELGELDEAESTARKATEALTHADALQAVAQYLPQQRIERIFTRNEVERWPASALAAVVPRMPETLLPEVNGMLTNPPIEDRHQRGQAQLRLLEVLVYRGFHAAAIEALPYLEDSLSASAVLAGTAADLSEPLLKAAIAFVKAVPNSGSYLALLLAELSRHGGAEEAITQIETVDDDWARAEGFLRVLQSGNLDEPCARQIFARLQEIYTGRDSGWAVALERLAPHSPFHLLDDAVAAAKKLTDRRDRVLPHLVVRLAQAGRESEARAEIASISDESWRQCAQALLEVVNPTVADRPLHSAVGVARGILDAYVRSHAVWELMRAVELNGYAETVSKASRRETNPEGLAALQESINFEFLMDDALEFLHTSDKPLAAQKFALVAPRISGTRMKKAWGLVQSLREDNAAHLHALTAITKRAAVLGWTNWLVRLTPLLIRVLDEHYKNSVIHLGATSRRIGLRAPSVQERIYLELVREEAAVVICGLVPETVRVGRLANYLEQVRQRPKYNEIHLWRHVLTGELPFFELLSPADLHACVRSTLEVQARGSRPEMLDDMELFAGVLCRLGGAQTVLEAIKAIRHVARWWP